MSYTCTCYSNTGYNAVNIPDSPARLTGGVTFPALVILQERVLTSLRIKATWAQAKDIDYCKIGEWYYIVTGVRMTSTDVAELTVIPDYITSAGGAIYLQFLDGITVRHNVSADEDVYGAFTETDPYLSPSKPLQIDTAGWKGADDGTSADVTFITTTLNLGAMGASDYSAKAVTFTDSNDSGVSVTVPKAEYASQSSNYSIPDGKKSAFVSGVTTYLSNSDVLAGANVARSLGVESAITAQYAIPASYVEYTTGSDGNYLTSCKGTSGTSDSGLAYDYATVRNKRVLYGELNLIGIITANGNKAEYNPEDVRGSDSTFQVQYITDPRESGKPYFAPKQYHGNTDIWGCNPVGGAEWRDVPLVFTKQSGSVLNAYNYNADSKLARSQQTQGNVNRWLGVASNALERANNAADRMLANPLAGSASLSTGVLATALDVVQAGSDQYFSSTQYDIARERELYNFGVSQTVVLPTVMFPYGDTTLRDYVGNNVYIYRYRPQSADVIKLDKILSMYGYRDTAPLTQSMLTNKTYFNYVQANGVSIAGTLPMWHKAGIAEQFSAGVRIWHTAPSQTYFEMQ